MNYSLDVLLGGKVQWCYSKRFKEWNLLLLYYKVKAIQQLKPQVLQLMPLLHYSGFILPGRGLHWNRKCKIKKN